MRRSSPFSIVSYAAFHDPTPASWRVELPDGAWTSGAYVFVGADFPVADVEVWLDSRRLSIGPRNTVTLDLSGVEPGEYVALVRIRDHRGVQFERAQRIAVAGP